MVFVEQPLALHRSNNYFMGNTKKNTSIWAYPIHFQNFQIFWKKSYFLVFWKKNQIFKFFNFFFILFIFVMNFFWGGEGPTYSIFFIIQFLLFFEFTHFFWIFPIFFKVSMVTSNSYWGYYWTPKISINSNNSKKKPWPKLSVGDRRKPE